VIQRLEALLLVLQVFRSPDEFLHGFDIKKLVDVVVVSQEIGWDFSRPLELSVLSDYGLDFFDKCVFGVVTGNFEGPVVRVLKLLGFSKLDDPGRNRGGAVRSRLIKTDFY
jgi:hypothetical protein